ncbi:MAG: hypothetical protein AAF940_10920 [Pseudomonadota bacterium]
MLQQNAYQSEVRHSEVEHNMVVHSFTRHMALAPGDPDEIAESLRDKFHALLDKRDIDDHNGAWRRRHVDRFEAALEEATERRKTALQTRDSDFSVELSDREKPVQQEGRRGGVFFRLAGQGENSSERMIEVAINAEPLSPKGRAEFAVGYANSSGGENGLCRFKLEPGKNVYSFRCAVGKRAQERSAYTDYLGIWPDTNGQGNGVLINDVVIREVNDLRH